MVKLNCSVIMVLQLVACVHTTPPAMDLALLPAEIRGRFSECRLSEGGTVVKLFSDGQYLGQQEVEWLGEKWRWQLAAYNRLGQQSMLIKVEREKFIKSGRLVHFLKDINVNKEGYLTYAGRFIGLRLDELSCLLPYRLPRAWLLNLTQFTRLKNKAQLLFEWDKRSILLTLFKKEKKTACAEISWPYFLNLRRRTLKWCSREKKKTTDLGETNVVEVSIGGVDKKILKWVLKK